MDFITQNEAPPSDSIDPSGTHLQGYLSATRRQLERAFGKSMGISDDCKVRDEWHLRFGDRVVAAIYDWKNPDRLGEDEVYQWHIGAQNRATVERVHEAFRSRLGLGMHRAADSQP